MEILTWVLDSALAHRDSLDNGSIIRPGDMQRMTAGTGIRHSEFNASQSDPVHFLQIWILPERRDLAPGYAQQAFAASELVDRLRLIASPDGREGSVLIHQDVALYVGRPVNGAGLSYRLVPRRRAWLQVTRGDVRVGSTLLAIGDGMACTEMGDFAITAADGGAEVLPFDLL